MTKVISVENLSKIYRLGQIGTGTFTNDLKLWWARTRGKSNPLLKIGQADHGNRSGEELWALRDVSFTVEQGEVLGIIGRNGAGKSTLLKILSRVTAPTSGVVKVKGRIASLLEVGTGFHPELTGRENIYLNGAILGMTRDEVTRKFDEIVDFAEIEKFIDTPVKRYSSGMYVRLAFAVAAHLDPEILVVDEVLAVGDAEFQKKCLGKMGDVAKEGRTVLFVSHNMNSVQTLCNAVIILEYGQIYFSGSTSEGIGKYINSSNNKLNLDWIRKGHNDKPMTFSTIKAQVHGEQPYLTLKCVIELNCNIHSPKSFLAVDIMDRNQTPILQAIPELQPFITGEVGSHKITVEINLTSLNPGMYHVSFWIGPHFTETIEFLERVISFEVTSSPIPNRTFPYSLNHGHFSPISRHLYQPPLKVIQDRKN